MALIDSGATHNFIGEKEAVRLGLKLTPTAPFNVRVADGHPLRSRGAYRKVAMELAGEVFPVDFYCLSLGSRCCVRGKLVGAAWASGVRLESPDHEI